MTSQGTVRPPISKAHTRVLKLSGLSSRWSKHVTFRTERDKHMARSLMKVSSGAPLLENQGEQMADQGGLVLEHHLLWPPGLTR